MIGKITVLCFTNILLQLGESTGVVCVAFDGCCNIAVQSCYFIIPWQHVQSCMNMAVDLSWWFQQRCSSLFVHQATSSLFQHAWTSLSTTLLKLHGQLQACSSSPAQPCSSLSTRKKQAVRFYVCIWQYPTSQQFSKKFSPKTNWSYADLIMQYPKVPTSLVPWQQQILYIRESSDVVPYT